MIQLFKLGPSGFAFHPWHTIGCPASLLPAKHKRCCLKKGAKDMKPNKKERLHAKVDEARKEVVERVLNLMATKDLAWIKEWSASCAAPFNGETGRKYSGGNRLYLMGKYDDPRWFTFAQASRQGFFPRKGERSSIVEYWKPRHCFKDSRGNIIDAEEAAGLDDAVPFSWLQLAGVFHVFNAAQLADADGNAYPELDGGTPAPVLDETLCETTDSLISSSRCPVNEIRSNRAYYSPSQDAITVPLRTKFTSMESFVSTLTHEMTHSTAPALGRDISGSFGTKDYAYEELVAELGSLFCCLDMGIERPTELEADENFANHAAYLQSWMKSLSDDPSYLFHAAAAADKASAYLMGRLSKSGDPH